AAKRRTRAQAGLAALGAQKGHLHGLVFPANLGSKISFTMKPPEDAVEGVAASSINVVLYQDAFYVPKAHGLPSNLRNLKIDQKQGVTVPWYPNTISSAWYYARMIAGWITMK
ncbi:unnamed protein product, partial [Durusdinium trenchii]